MNGLETRVFKVAELCGWTKLDVKRYAAEVYGKPISELSSQQLWETFKDLRHLTGFQDWMRARRL